MYADSVTDSMERAITETERRREIQKKYNEEHGIIPKTIIKDVHEVLEISSKVDSKDGKKLSKKQKEELIKTLTKEMYTASKMLEFEHAAYLRDKINKLKNQ